MDDKLHDEDGRLAALRRYEIIDTAEEEPFQRVVELVQTILDVPAAAISVIDANRQWYKASRGIQAKGVPRDISFCTETIKSYGPMAVADTLNDGRFANNPTVLGAPYVRSYLGVPLTTPDGYNIGTLCAIDVEPRPFDARQADILNKLAAIVVEQFELRQIARQDAMTGGLTRRGFFAEVEREFLRATRYDRPSSLLMIDVDHFRTVNDRHGHAAGDAVLISIANAAMATMRKSDIFGRIGGEEFGLLLPETDGEEAFEAAERIRRIVEATIVEVGGASIRATISIGVAPIPAPAEGAATWHSEADIALYEAKRFGRNRVVAGRPRRPAPLATDEKQQQARPN